MALMSADEMRDLGQRAVACKRWRWTAGMLCRGERLRVTRDDPNPMVTDGSIPDFEDPATLGCLLALVREAWGGDGISGYYLHQRAYLLSPPSGRMFLADTEAEALVVALEEAPEQGEGDGLKISEEARIK